MPQKPASWALPGLAQRRAGGGSHTPAPRRAGLTRSSRPTAPVHTGGSLHPLRRPLLPRNSGWPGTRSVLRLRGGHRPAPPTGPGGPGRGSGPSVLVSDASLCGQSCPQLPQTACSSDGLVGFLRALSLPQTHTQSPSVSTPESASPGRPPLRGLSVRPAARQGTAPGSIPLGCCCSSYRRRGSVLPGKECSAFYSPRLFSDPTQSPAQEELKALGLWKGPSLRLQTNLFHLTCFQTRETSTCQACNAAAPGSATGKGRAEHSRGNAPAQPGHLEQARRRQTLSPVPRAWWSRAT